MGPLTFVMAIMGCTDGGAACQEARIEPLPYRSILTCQAAMPAALQRNTDIDYPTVSATCRATGHQMAQTSGDAIRRSSAARSHLSRSAAAS